MMKMKWMTAAVVGLATMSISWMPARPAASAAPVSDDRRLGRGPRRAMPPFGIGSAFAESLWRSYVSSSSDSYDAGSVSVHRPHVRNSD